MKSELPPVHFKETEYGFEYGSGKVDRLFSDKKKGWVIIGIRTPKEDLQIYITKTGKVGIHNSKGEIKLK